jgi:hypothetical protein
VSCCLVQSCYTASTKSFYKRTNKNPPDQRIEIGGIVVETMTRTDDLDIALDLLHQDDDEVESEDHVLDRLTDVIAGIVVDRLEIEIDDLAEETTRYVLT